MVEDQSDSERENPLPPHGLLFPISSKGYFTCTKDRSDDPSHHERTLLQRSYNIEYSYAK